MKMSNHERYALGERFFNKFKSLLKFYNSLRLGCIHGRPNLGPIAQALCLHGIEFVRIYGPIGSDK